MASASVIGIISVVASLAGSAASYQSSKNEQETQVSLAKYQARLLREKASEDERRARREAQIEMGRERAVLGKLGILPTVGSPLEQLARNAGEAERKSVLAGKGLLDQATMYQAQASSISGQQGYLAASGVLSGITALSSYGSPLLTTRTAPRTAA